jgi:general stress protein 26
MRKSGAKKRAGKRRVKSLYKNITSEIMNTREPDKHNLYNEAAIKKMKILADHSPVCLFTTMLEQHPLTTRPMSVRKVCDEGNFWFLSSIDSNKNIEIGVDERVQLFFSNVSDVEFLSVYGKATIITDKEKIEELWNNMAKTWFIEGIDDPTLSVIKVEPLNAEYWDVKHGKMVSLLKIAVSTGTGAAMGNGESGKLVMN